MDEVKYCLLSKTNNNTYVKRFTFDEGGIGADFTHDVNEAARCSLREVVDHLLPCIIIAKCKVVVWHRKV